MVWLVALGILLVILAILLWNGDVDNVEETQPKKYTREELIYILSSMRVILGLSRTEKDALNQVIAEYLKKEG